MAEIARSGAAATTRWNRECRRPPVYLGAGLSRRRWRAESGPKSRLTVGLGEGCRLFPADQPAMKTRPDAGSKDRCDSPSTSGPWPKPPSSGAPNTADRSQSARFCRAIRGLSSSDSAVAPQGSAPAPNAGCRFRKNRGGLHHRRRPRRRGRHVHSPEPEWQADHPPPAAQHWPHEW